VFGTEALSSARLSLQIQWRTAADVKIKYGTNVRLGVVSIAAKPLTFARRIWQEVISVSVLIGWDQHHESQGVKFHMSTKVEKIVAREDNPNLAGGVVVNGNTIPADFAVMGVGVAQR
jgi:hypothetical protein